MAGKARKATFNLRAEVLDAVNEAVTQGSASSKNAFVERALVRELQDLRRVERRKRWQEASQDPLFLNDIAELETVFQPADAETARAIG
jgi:hypothetical protein